MPNVRERLFALVDSSPRPLLVAQERELGEGGAFERRMPYRHLIEHRAKLSIVLVADDGYQGLWRDPIGALAEREFKSKKEIAAAVGGYMLFRDGFAASYIKRDLWDPLSDVRVLVARFRLDIPIPEKPRAEPKRPKAKPHRAAEPAPAPELPPIDLPDPFAVLGLQRNCSEEELKKAFREQVVQYHPDKVAHLAPEFQTLAEEKTRALTAAYQAAQEILRGEK